MLWDLLRPRPTVSLVVAVYGVEKYLPRFLSSLDRQTYPHERIQVVLVLDGAVDASPSLCRQWARATDMDVVVLQVPNGGQGRARNLGLAQAVGEWVGFPDPDDELAPEFLSTLTACARPEAGMLIARTLVQHRGALVPHPLDARFERGVRTVNVNQRPHAVQLSVHEILVRGSLAHQCCFPEDREPPTFEDAMYVGRVRGLDPVCVLVPEALYTYKKRLAGDSAVQAGWSQPGRYVEQIRQRYLRFLDEAHAVPWAQLTVLYDLGWYAGVADRGEVPDQPAELAPEHARLVAELARNLDPELVTAAPWPHLTASARARLLLWHGEQQVAVVRDGRVESLYTPAAVHRSSVPALYARTVVGFVTHGEDAESLFDPALAVRVGLQAPQLRV